MKKTAVILLTFVLLAAGCTERRNHYWTDNAVGYLKTSSQGNETAELCDDEAAQYDTLDMDAVQALEEKVNNKETLTQEEMDLYLQAEEMGYVFKELSEHTVPTTNEGLSASDKDQWKGAFEDKVPLLNTGRINAVQNVQVNNKTIAVRVVVVNVDLETAKDYIKNFEDDTWHQLNGLDTDKSDLQSFGNIIENKTDGAMQRASTMIDEYDTNADWQAAYFTDSEENICEVLIEEDKEQTGTFCITITVVDNR